MKLNAKFIKDNSWPFDRSIDEKAVSTIKETQKADVLNRKYYKSVGQLEPPSRLLKDIETLSTDIDELRQTQRTLNELKKKRDVAFGSNPNSQSTALTPVGSGGSLRIARSARKSFRKVAKRIYGYVSPAYNKHRTRYASIKADLRAMAEHSSEHSKTPLNRAHKKAQYVALLERLRIYRGILQTKRHDLARAVHDLYTDVLYDTCIFGGMTSDTFFRDSLTPDAKELLQTCDEWLAKIHGRLRIAQMDPEKDARMRMVLKQVILIVQDLPLESKTLMLRYFKQIVDDDVKTLNSTWKSITGWGGPLVEKKNGIVQKLLEGAKERDTLERSKVSSEQTSATQEAECYRHFLRSVYYAFTIVSDHRVLSRILNGQRIFVDYAAVDKMYTVTTSINRTMLRMLNSAVASMTKFRLCEGIEKEFINSTCGVLRRRVSCDITRDGLKITIKDPHDVMMAVSTAIKHAIDGDGAGGKVLPAAVLPAAVLPAAVLQSIFADRALWTHLAKRNQLIVPGVSGQVIPLVPE